MDGKSLYVKITWPDIDAILEWLLIICIWIQVLVELLNVSFQRENFSAIFDHISSDWERYGRSYEGKVLRKYAAHGRWVTKAFYGCMCCSCTSYIIMPIIIPKIVKIFQPSNGTSEKVYLFKAYYVVNSEDYYWFLYGHGSWTTILVIAVMVTYDAMFFVLAEHCCALFKVVEINLEKIRGLDSDRKDSSQDAGHYDIICHCINLHGEAITFTDLINNTYNGCMLIILGASLLQLSTTQVQILIHLDEPADIFRFMIYTVAQILRLYLFSVPGQKIMDHSLSICNSAYSVDWHNLTPRVQKSIILIMIRSQRQCYISAGSIYYITMENFSSILQTSMSIFTLLSSMQ